MPELPDVEIFRRYLDATSLHRTIDDITLKAERLLHDLSRKRLTETLDHNRFASTLRHGKYLLVELEKGGVWLVLHFGMTGSLSYYEKRDEPPEHTQLLLSFTDGSALAYISQRKFGEIRLAEDPESFIEKMDLGRDAYEPELSFAELRDLLRGHRAALKSALTKQSLIAGIGNVYGDEILFRAELAPKLRSDQLSDEQLGRLHRAIRYVLDKAIERKADPDEVPRTWLLRHRKPGAGCPRCGGEIAAYEVSGRRGYWCPKCQDET